MPQNKLQDNSTNVLRVYHRDGIYNLPLFIIFFLYLYFFLPSEPHVYFSTI